MWFFKSFPIPNFSYLKEMKAGFFNSLRADKNSQKVVSFTIFFAMPALVAYLFMSYSSVCVYKIRGFSHVNLNNFAGNLSLISLMLLRKKTRQSVEKSL